VAQPTTRCSGRTGCRVLDRIANHREVAFIALDETGLSVGLGISAVTCDPQEVGRQAALLAVKRITTPDTPPRTITLPSKLVRRGSGELPPSNGSPRWSRARDLHRIGVRCRTTPENAENASDVRRPTVRTTTTSSRPGRIAEARTITLRFLSKGAQYLDRPLERVDAVG
jgi:hypothetical protein